MRRNHFFTYSLLHILFWTLIGFSAKAETWIVEADKPLSAKEISFAENQLQSKIKLFDSISSPYFKRVYQIQGDVDAIKIRSLPWVKAVEGISEIKLQSVEPSATQSNYSNDPLLPYQWAVDNTGQTVTYDIDDIRLERVAGVINTDIELPPRAELERAFKRDAVVAVIDTGVDTDHPDLKDNIFRNTPECLNGELILRPKDDVDGNGYKGDCKGWDFSGKDPDSGHRVLDDLGHGTHVAGIMSATPNNDEGISGISSRIKILPIKVFIRKGTSKLGLTDRLAKAILYAVTMKVDVINLSLGWPIAFDKKYLREAIKLAISQNIVVVAAGGNNDHSSPILPCALEGVLCVGSISHNNQVSQFSNFGPHIDVLAPGDNVISTYPTSLTPDIFSVTGYEIKSGTSQSAPYVSALAAILKTQIPDAQSVQNQIITTSKKEFQSQKSFLTGPISFKKALTTKKSMVLPIFKENDRVTFKMSQKSFLYSLNLFNTGSEGKTIRAKFQSDNAKIRLEQPEVSVDIPGRSQKSLIIKGRILDPRQNSEFNLTVSLDNRIYRQKVVVSRDLSDDKSTEILTVPGLTKPNLLSVIFRHRSPNTPEYYTIDTSEQETTLTLYRIQSKELLALNTFKLKNVSRILNFSGLDLNNDNSTDYQLIAIVKEGDDSLVRYFNFDNELKPLRGWPQTDLVLDGVIQIDNQLSYLYKKDGALNLAVPFFFASGLTPELDQPKDLFKPRENFERNRLYYFDPVRDPKTREIKYFTRTVDSTDRLKQWAKQLGLRAFSNVSVLNSLPQTELDLAQNQLRLLVSYGYDFDRSTAVVTTSLSEDGELVFNWQQLETHSLVIDGYEISQTINLESPNTPETTLIGPLLSHQWEKLMIHADASQTAASRLISDDKSESINLHIKSYRRGGKQYSFLQTVSELLFIAESSSGIKKFTAPYHVSTFLLGFNFQDTSTPIWAFSKSEKNLAPALYVDSSLIVSKNAFLLIGSEKGRISPMNLNVNIPDNCLSLKPMDDGQAANLQDHFTL